MSANKWLIKLLILLISFSATAETITWPGDYTAGDPITAAGMNTRFTLVYNLVNGELDAANIEDGAIGNNELADGAVSLVKLANDAVTSAKIAAGAVTATEIADGSVETVKLSNDAVTNAKIATGAVGSTELASETDSLAKVSGGVMVSSDGFIGIGTVNPYAPLEVKTTSSDAEALTALFRASDGSNLQLLQPDTADDDDPFTWYTGNALQWRIDSLDAMSITDTGSVYIGTEDFTSTTGGNLHIGRWVDNGPGGSLFLINNSEDFGETRLYMGRDYQGRGVQLRTKPGSANGMNPALYIESQSDNEGFGTIMSLHDNGAVGIGTDAPDALLEVATAGDSISGLTAPGALRISDATPQLDFISSNGSDYAIHVSGGKMYFVSEPWYPGNLVLYNGNVGIGTDNPTFTLQVNGSAYCTNGLWNTSDGRYKENISPIQSSLEKLSKIDGVSFTWKPEFREELHVSEGGQIGLIAQDVEEVFPELVNTDAEGYKAVAYDKFTAVLLQAIKEQQEQIEAQEERLDRQAEELEHLRSTLERIDN